MKPTETIFSGKSVIVPMADVQHIERRTDGIIVITNGTKWNFEYDTWENNIWISNHEDQANEFIKAWCHYRAEIDGMMEE